MEGKKSIQEKGCTERNMFEATEMDFLSSFVECYAMFEAESSNLI